jgi:2-polyprenyl-3-methyl-5-hydroxy-6-metoxy-1,4-benzoquinol methylase
MGKVSIVNLAASRIRNRTQTKLLRLERKLTPGDETQAAGFFDAYPRFFETSTSGYRNRLNRRYAAIIEPNLDIVRGKTILDIASHDGRWSLAAMKAGARFVLGIEAREHLVKNARENLREYGVPEAGFEFLQGDVFEMIGRIEPDRIDTVFCLGFFYHTMYHMLLLNQIARLRPKHLILDTCIDKDPDAIIALQYEGVADETAGAVADEGDQARLLVGSPTKKALEMMLESTGFSCRYIDWSKLGVKNWQNLKEYHEGLRVTVVAERQTTH